MVVVVDEECFSVERGELCFSAFDVFFTCDFVESFADFVVVEGFELCFVVDAYEDVDVCVRDVEDVEEPDLVFVVVYACVVDVYVVVFEEVLCFLGGVYDVGVVFEEGVDADAEVVRMTSWVGSGDEGLCFSLDCPCLRCVESF